MEEKNRYLLDTNIISEFMRRNPIVVSNMEKAAEKEDSVFICPIVRYEIERGLKAAGKFRRLKEFEEFCENYSPLYFDRNDDKVIDKAVDIYVQLLKGKNIGDNDIYIAAMAIVNDCVLVTDNIKHFQRIEGLKLINWKEKIL